MATWRIARSLSVLRDQINAARPNRSHVSDGSIGDLAHSQRKSDHNPDAEGVVRAYDFTHDPANGFDSYLFAEQLRLSRDPRIKYVISNRRIFASYGNASRAPWTWGPYTGTNPHTKHVHVSVVGTSLADSTSPWSAASALSNQNVVYHPPAPHNKYEPFLNTRAGSRTIKLYSCGSDVMVAQGAVGVKNDGKFGPATEASVKAYQKRAGLSVDGIVGPKTWAKMLALTVNPPAHSTPTAPPFPLPRGYYFGPKSGPKQSVSGYYSHRADLKRWQQRMHDRGWNITVDGLYGPQTEYTVRHFQSEKHLAVDGKIGPATWAAAWTTPRTLV